MKAVCPKCRYLGLATDCSERLKRAGNPMNPSDEPDYELEVTLRFTVPVTSSLPYDPHDMALHMREKWVSEDADLLEVLVDSIDGDYDLQVKPTFFQ